ncbi:hypothetical protein B0H17DRAFT_1324231 [Mycena rosella]|uniref:Uncharacterized protein n=1 Tax=Mycena rosella TaxID=1033263 RepID=A0AAD7H2P0_MYCRO|nr:hypothetical protein B0H17DRAFT_1324231 [Mycena rosella]
MTVTTLYFPLTTTTTMAPQPSSPTPPSTPRPVDDLLALTQQLTPSKSPRTLRKIRHDIQLQANDVQQEHVTLKRRAVDGEQQVNLTRRPRKKRKRGDRARDADDTEFNAEATEARIRDVGCSFAIQKALFLIDDDILDTEETQDFDIDQEFDSTENECQGQLRDILALLPNDVRPKISQPWVQDSFLDGLHGQRASIRHRLRTEALHIIAENVKDFTTSASRFDTFSKFIGYKSATGSSEPFYDRFEWDGKIDLDHLFRGDVLLKVFASIIRGPRGAEGLFEGKSKLPQAKCLERIHKITHITPGAIVVAAILAIWLFSADTQLVKVGDETTIDYAARHRLYIRRIREGLRDKKAWAVGLIEYWNHILFPNTDKSRDHGKAGSEQLEDDEEIDAIFTQASQVDSSPNNSSHCNEDEHDQLRTSSPTPAPQPQQSRHSSTSSRGSRVNWRGR